MCLPIFSLTTYNVKGSILTLPKAFESREMNSLVKTADVWLKSLNVYHNEHHFVKKKECGG
jgi:hypothetical protein